MGGCACARGGGGSGCGGCGVGVWGGGVGWGCGVGVHTHTFQASGHVCERSPRCSYAGHGASHLNILNIYIELQADNDRLTDRQSNERERERKREREKFTSKRDQVDCNKKQLNTQHRLDCISQTDRHLHEIGLAHT